MPHLHDLTLRSFAEGLREKKFSAFEMAKEFFEFIEAKDKEIGAYLSLDKEGALQTAHEVDLMVGKDEVLPTLAGAPLALKDNFLVGGLSATAGSKILKNYIAAYDATVVSKLKTQKAVLLGKTNLDEFAMGSSTENSGFKITKNPHDLERVPGGSSGGSAAAVASHMAVAALGSDTGGSVREPASFCGVVGLKPTYGAVSRYGLIAMASSLDQIGPLTKTVEDAAILFKAIAGKDDFDSTSADCDYGELVSPNLEDVKNMIVGLPKEYFIAGLSAEVSKEVEEVIHKLKSLGVGFKEISLPHTKYALSCYYIIMPAEVSSNLARFDGIRYARNSKLKTQNSKLMELYFENRGMGFGDEARRRIILGTFVLSSGYYDAYYAKAQKVRRLIKEDFDKVFDKADGGVDALLTPVVPTQAFKIGEKMDDPLSMYLSDILTIPVNLAGLPAISIPVQGMYKEGAYIGGERKSLPVGFQLIGRHFGEKDILAMGQIYEKI